MTTPEFLGQLESVRPRGTAQWSARCPAHRDRTPSLSIRETGARILLHCFSSCTPEEIVSALGLEMRDLFMDSPISQGQRPAPTLQKLDLIAVAFRFELAALDRRLRAERIITAGKALDVSRLNNADLDDALSCAAQAYADMERAELFEHVADTLRMKDYAERVYGQQRRVA